MKLLVALVVLLGLTSTAASGASFRTGANGPPAVIDALGFWSLGRLNSGPIVFAHVDRESKQTIPYELPAGARQGPSTWYAIRLHARVTLGPGTGRAYVFAAHNGFVSALVEFDVRKTANGRRIVQRTVSYIDGSMVKLVRNDQSEFHFRNFVQYRGVRPGLNQLTFSVEVNGSLTLDKAEIFADSGIDYTRRGPAHIRLTIHVPQAVLRFMHASHIVVEVRNVGDRVVRHVVASIDFPNGALRVAGQTRMSLGGLKPRAIRRSTFRLIPLRRGTIRVVFSGGGSGGNQPAVARTLVVR